MQFNNEKIKLTRAEQARISGAKSKGPSSPEGRQKSSQNARKHGLYASRDIALTTEQHSDLDAFRARNYAEYRPVDQRQQNCVYRIVNAEWTHLRLTALETWLVDNQISKMRFEIPLMYGDREPVFDLRPALVYERLLTESRALQDIQRERRALVRTIRNSTPNYASSGREPTDPRRRRKKTEEKE